jgi:hypothetical protein
LKEAFDKTPRRRSAIRTAALAALGELLEPLTGFVLDAGVSVHELENLVRIAAVRSVANRQRELGRRVNISGIAASTGIPRAEISRILRMPAERGAALAAADQHATNRILAVWHDDPQYVNSSGQPLVLKIFGPEPSFDGLVKRHGGGIPTRALLDELVGTGSVEIEGGGHVRARSFFAADRGLSPGAVKAFGDRASELLATMLAKMRDPDSVQFLSNVETPIVAADSLPIYRREIATRGEHFLAGLRDSLFAADVPKRARRAGLAPRVSVTLFYHETSTTKALDKSVRAPRRNLRRA